MSATATTAEQLLEALRRAPADDRARVLMSTGGADRAIAQLIDHASTLTATDAAAAIDATELVVDLADKHGSTLDQARARRARARALSYTGRFDDALHVARHGIQLAERAGNQIEAARARLASMHALGELGRLDEAIHAGELARAAFLAAGEPMLAARADINLGIANLRRDDPTAALSCFDRARPFLASDPLTLGHLENSRGEALVASNDFSAAERAFQAALTAFQNANAALTAAIAEGNLADLAARRGQLQRALYHFEGARRHLEADAAPGHVARLRAEQAEAMNQLGMPQQSLTEYREALPVLDRCGLALEAARARSGMGIALLRLGHAAEAETALAAAAKSFDELGHLTQRAKVDLWRAEIALRQGRITPARTLLLQAMAVLHERPAESATARFLLARAALSADRLEEAELELAASLSLARNLDLAPLLADVLVARGLLRRRQRRLAEAVADFKEAVAQIERVRNALRAERFRTAYLGDRAAAYHCLIQTLLDVGGECATQEAFALAEQSKSRSLLELMHPSLEAGDRRAPADGGRDQSNLVIELARAREELTALYSGVNEARFDEHAPHDLSRWRHAVRQREREIDALEARLATTGGIGSLYAPTINPSEAIKLAEPGSAIVEYVFAGAELLAFVICNGEIQHVRGLAHQDEIARAMTKLRFQINRALRPGAHARVDRLRQDAQRELRSLENMVFAPVRPFIAGMTRLTIVPHGALHMLPFHALFDGQKHLIESHEIAYAPSVSLLAQLNRTQADRRSSSEPLIVGFADEIAPRIEEEARLVEHILSDHRPMTLVGAEATVDRVAAALERAAIAHLACHGRFSPDAPLGSGLKLADRWLTVRDICELRIQANLVTLSGCETGLNQISAGDELMGLLRGFFAAGASSALVSLWRVDDATTAEFMRAFYDRLQGSADSGTNKAAALRDAQLQLMKQRSHPAFWAPFVLQGRRE